GSWTSATRQCSGACCARRRRSTRTRWCGRRPRKCWARSPRTNDMADDEKAKLYKEIVQKADERTVLERMRLHGFWPADQGLPTDPPMEARERTQIETELFRLRREHAVVRDPEKALAEERRRRWEESKQRRAAAKAQRQQDRARRREAWGRHRDANIVHTGADVSGGLQKTTSDTEALQRRGLPVLHTGADVASAMGTTVAALRWLTYHRKSATLVHYHRYSIAKKTRGVRYISAPKRALATAQ